MALADMGKLNKELAESSRMLSSMDVVFGAIGFKLLQSVKFHDIISGKMSQEQKTQEEIARINKKIGDSYNARVSAAQNAGSHWHKARGLAKLLEKETEDAKKDALKGRLLLENRMFEEEKVRAVDTRLQVKELKALMADTKGELPLARFEDTLRKSGMRLGWYAGLMKFVITSSWDFNEALIDSNSSLEARNDIFASSLAVQAKTGLETRTLTEAYVALQHQGQLHFKGINASAEAIGKMRVGLGVSVETSAELLAISRSLGISFEHLGDVLATVADSTSVTAQQAAEIAKSVGNVAYGFGYSGANVGGTVKLIASIQDQMNALGDTQKNTIEKFVLRLSKTEDLGGQALRFGARAPAGLAGRSPQEIEHVLRGLTMWYDQMSRMPEAAWEGFAHDMGSDTTELMRLINAMKTYGKTLTVEEQHTKTLNERYLNQVNETNKSLGNLFNSFKALLVEAFQPLIPTVQHVTEVLGFFRDMIIKIKGAVPDEAKPWVEGGASLGLGILGGWEIIRVIRAMGKIGVIGKIARLLFGFGAKEAVAGGATALGETVLTGSTAMTGYGAVGTAAAAKVAAGQAGSTIFSSVLAWLITPAAGMGIAAIVVSVLGMLAIGGGLGAIAYYWYRMFRAREELAAQIPRQIEERKTWGDIYTQSVTAKMQAALEDFGPMHGNNPNDIMINMVEAFGEGGTAIKEWNLGFLTAAKLREEEERVRSQIVARVQTGQYLYNMAPDAKSKAEYLTAILKLTLSLNALQAMVDVNNKTLSGKPTNALAPPNTDADWTWGDVTMAALGGAGNAAVTVTPGGPIIRDIIRDLSR